ncbi:MAG: hypothetical protein JKY53_02785 [Flavobacteriales bacterium]|nr:hypothetical protein [Flavobacteriales bacterium]
MMKRKSKIVLSLAAGFICFQAFTPKSTGSHPSSTGAPGELTCAKSGCHVNAVINPGDGVNTHTFKNSSAIDVTGYAAGSTYSVEVNITQPFVSKFGFEIVALDANDNNAGSWIITDAARTWHQTTSAPSSLNRKYVTHESAGTSPTSAGECSWGFDWEAPIAGTGDVTFYYCTNGTNNNEQNSGDTLYFSDFTITEDAASGIFSNRVAESKTRINYLTKQNIIQAKVSADYGDDIMIKISDTNGRHISSANMKAAKSGGNEVNLRIEDNLSSGIYLVTVFVNNSGSTEKIFIPNGK